MSKSRRNGKRHGHCAGGKETATYRSWKAMRRRCDDPMGRSFKDYGASGITYAPEWADFDNFLNDMGECPSGHTIDRLDNKAGYSKANCRWATRTTQNRNRKNVVLSEQAAKEIFRRAWRGEPRAAIAEDYGCSPQLVSNIKMRKAWANVN